MGMSEYHKSVLLQEAVTALEVAKDKKYIDATLGAGGHTKEILERGGIVLGIDQDEDALDYIRDNFRTQIEAKTLEVARGNFAEIEEIARERGFTSVSGILFDVGVSSHQLDTNERGFSFLSDAALDMRMDRSLGVTAADLLKVLTKKQLYELFTEYGEENNAWRIAEAIDKQRHVVSIETTKQLADLVVRISPKKGKIHPATKVFQALRIAVNDELGSLTKGLQKGEQLLSANGKLVVISFHSLEDRIVKNTFLQLEKEKRGTILTEKPIVPTDTEREDNARARSAKMRVFIRSANSRSESSEQAGQEKI